MVPLTRFCTLSNSELCPKVPKVRLKYLKYLKYLVWMQSELPPLWRMFLQVPFAVIWPLYQRVLTC